MAVPQTDISALRAFNRFYTRRIGILDPYLNSDMSLTDVRVLYELAHSPDMTATDLGRSLALDTGYISRILKRFETKGWVRKTQSPKDGRQSLLSLTSAGSAKFAPLQERSNAEANDLLAPLTDGQRSQVMAAMASIERLLGQAESPPAVATLRALQPGDLGWIQQVHGEVYSREYGYDASFEAVVADIAATYHRASLLPGAQNQSGWIAEVDGERVGGILLVNAEDGVEAKIAKIRVLILTPAARGLGLAKRLVDECVAFARERGYERVILSTHEELTAARKIYASRGFKLVEAVEDEYWGETRVAETWELVL